MLVESERRYQVMLDCGGEVRERGGGAIPVIKGRLRQRRA
jgi:hypothetical protein